MRVFEKLDSLEILTREKWSDISQRNCKGPYILDPRDDYTKVRFTHTHQGWADSGRTASSSTRRDCAPAWGGAAGVTARPPGC